MMEMGFPKLIKMIPFDWFVRLRSDTLGEPYSWSPLHKYFSIYLILLCHITHHSAVCMQSQRMLAFAGV